ncbi:ArsR family transcriptional regulator [Coraliomargarita sinensis]|uniref:ArsR family transcriptional regulator n=1 Tax=Coraliomargarita sinensis TaxID=2174842 RepID=A0A317ZDN3_9BACT|nr:winged helix-turn-helix domain-containing protein [Coraliomargarita sinensis]PXA03415.1 ArsR family transcriptional regulator [Coraliomargarita sinensis]
MSNENTPSWNFLTNHSHVLICLARNAEQPLREVALSVGITERAVQRIVAELEEAGYLERMRVGRQNCYLIHTEGRLRHPLEAHRTIGALLDVVVPRPTKRIDLGGHGSEI